jgi:hypothetical protein
LLKSGTSFKKERIAKVETLFKPRDKKAKEKVALPDQDNDLAAIDEEINKLKASKPTDVEAYATEFKHQMNKRNDTLNKLRRKHGIKVEGEGCPEPLFSFP